MGSSNDSALKVAEFLLNIKAIKIQPSNPFTWASGWKSPIYCDNRKTLSFPNVRTYLRQEFVNTIEENFAKPDVIAGVATGGIAIGALVAHEMGLPFVYVRTAAKGHGLKNQVEGVLEEGQNVIMIEDLVSTGSSSLKAVEAIRESKCNVKGLVAIFSYGFQQAADAFKAANCPYMPLTDYDTLLKQAVKSNYITEDEVETLQDWRKDPVTWRQ